MRRHIARLTVALGLVALAGGALTGCATSSGGTSAPAPSETAMPEVLDLDAAWLDGGRMVGLITQGSSTCVPTAEVEGYADGVLRVTFVEDTEGPCTADFAPRVSLAPVPDDVDASENLVIEVNGEGYGGEVTLPAVDGLVFESPSEQMPSAGWSTGAGTFVVLLWGSSGCPETITATEVTGDAAVTASLSGIPADKACTADVVPNPVIAGVEGLEGVADVELTLDSPTGESYVTPILGVDGASAD